MGTGQEFTVNDAAGRTLKCRELSILNESRLVRLMGESASNQAYMVGYVLPAAMVTEIDGEPCDLPLTQPQVEAAIQRVGRHGLAAIMTHMANLADQERGAENALKK